MSKRDELVQARQARLIQAARTIAELAEGDVKDNEVRAMLQGVVRRWSNLMPPTHQTKAAKSAKRAGLPTHVEHVVPVRVLIDRVIEHPRQVRLLLSSCVITALVTPEEHRALGTMTGTHKALYAEMRSCRPHRLTELAWQRYASSGVRVAEAR